MIRTVNETTASETQPAATPTFDQCRARYGIFTECQLCGADLIPEHAHYKCRTCGWRDSCCD